MVYSTILQSFDRVIDSDEDIDPLLVFINPKSGGLWGRLLLPIFRFYLHPIQVVNLNLGSPEKALKNFESCKKFRILVCGGDISFASIQEYWTWFLSLTVRQCWLGPLWGRKAPFQEPSSHCYSSIRYRKWSIKNSSLGTRLYCMPSTMVRIP